MKLPSIPLGTFEGGKAFNADLEVLMESNLLVQANSGGGKSWALRRIVEQILERMGGRLPVIVIDPEGEFSTLREKYDLILVGKGGETPADPRSAALLAHRLLQLRVSAVCDLFELDPPMRKQWVANFISALVNAPKDLWSDVVVAIDEAHDFAPQAGHGETRNVAVSALPLVSLASKGRKRGQMTIAATQRLGKLSKDFAAELKNVLVGMTFIDIDRERAAENLGIGKGGRKAFFDVVKSLDPGHFWGIGRALCREATPVVFGAVSTTHPRRGQRRVAAPPPTDKVKHLLPQLADLPAEADKVLRTEAELRTEIRRLTKALQDEVSRKPVAVVEPRIVEVMPARVVEHLGTVARLAAESQDAADALRRMVRQVTDSAASALQVGTKVHVKSPGTNGAFAVGRLESEGPPPRGRLVAAAPERTAARTAPRPPPGPEGTRPGGGVLRILAAIKTSMADGLTWKQVAQIVGIRPGGSTFSSYKSRAITGGYVEERGGLAYLTVEGEKWADQGEVPQSGPELIEFWKRERLNGQQARMLDAALARGPGSAISRDELAAATEGQIPATGSTFSSYLSRMRTFGVLIETSKGEFTAAEMFFR